ncbi:hypothetical protein JNO54_08635 [Janibacter sp. YIM B02568]|jgi:hypothetical protein|uniref:hypothetical protein n=1 Tax=Janibacter endophyticus TaxID=2806261 RepID=UPI001950CC6E|nr:hypothetical protein [Janibacter endophyticus]MBM6546206.1 hypothetical protein [Janibacter endophyticus]
MTGPEEQLAEVVETLLERLREIDADELADRLVERDPAIADRLLTGLVVIGEALGQAFSDAVPAEPRPARARIRIAVRDDDALDAGETAG